MQNLFCCINCFSEKHQRLRDFISDQAQTGTCDYCESEEVSVIEAKNLYPLFIEVLNLYDLAANYMGTEDLKAYDGDIENLFIDKLNYEWEVFGEKISLLENENHLLEEIFKEDDNALVKLQQSVGIEREYYGDHFGISDTFSNAWEHFKNELTTKNRYFPKTKLDLDKLEYLLSFYKTFVTDDVVWYRSRVMESKNQVKYDCDSMGIPSQERTRPGRANPIGIPYLYLSSSIDTAIIESRPTKFDNVTVAHYKPRQDLEIIDLSRRSMPSPFGVQAYELLDYLMHSRFLNYLASDISKPVSPNKSELYYMPMQYIFEFIKKCNYSGVMYKSSIAEGENLVVFYADTFHCLSTSLLWLNRLDINLGYSEFGSVNA